MTLASTSALEGGRTITEYRATGTQPGRMTPQREQALERIGDRQGLIRELAIAADVYDGVIRGLVKTGAIEAGEVDSDSPFTLPDPGHAVPTLSPEPHAAAHAAAAEGGARELRPRQPHRRPRTG